MRLVSYKIGQGAGYGAVVGDHVARLGDQPDAAPDLKAFIAAAHARGWAAVTEQVQAVAADLPLADVQLLPPIPNPDKVLCVATNFHEPARAGKPVPDYPLLFTRFGNSFTGHGQPLIRPAETEKYDFEGELAVIIGKRGRRIPAETAMDYVAGYSCLNDGSVRDWQKHSSQFTPGKNFVASGACGPWLVTADEIPDPTGLHLQTRVNGIVMQQIAIDQMIFDIPWLIAYVSTFTELVPGDVLATGTPSGFGSTRTPPVFLMAGDRVEVEIGGVGLLANVVADDRAA